MNINTINIMDIQEMDDVDELEDIRDESGNEVERLQGDIDGLKFEISELEDMKDRMYGLNIESQRRLDELK